MKKRLSLNVTSLILCAMIAFIPAAEAKKKQHADTYSEGKLLTPSVTVGPFDLHRKYRSMEGPYADKEVAIGELVSSGHQVVGEEMVRFVENGGQASMSAQPSTFSTSVSNATANEPRQMYWLKGVRIDLFDENDQPLPTAEFFCHLNIDADPGFRNQAFPEGERCVSARLFTLTQGQTEMMFPKGYGVPVASDEKLRCIFQAANRTTSDHRRIKQQLTFYLIPDKQLLQPLTALNWFTPFMAVVVDKNTQDAITKEEMDCSICAPTSRGVTAPNAVNNAVENDAFGRKVSGHWVIPPGKSVWTEKIRDYNFQDKPRVAHLIWSHVHPLCTDFSLLKVDGTNQVENVFTATCRSKTSPGVQIEHIDLFSSSEGIRLEANKPYELEIKYNNPTGQGLDSMATMGIFCEDNGFARPQWAIATAESIRTCGVTGSCVASEHQAALQPTVSTMPIFDPTRDGPALAQPVQVRLKTDVGSFSLILQPSWAPLAATQMCKLFKNGCFDGTAFYRMDDYLMQLGVAEGKVAGYPPLSQAAQGLLRRIPVELDAEKSHLVKHRAGVLSMARETNDPVGNVSSFSIMLRDWPDLDEQYTIFGELANDPETKKTIESLKSAWRENKHPLILSSEVVQPGALSISANPH
jgi:cyclophilin family peptidyl-prolyl cis-trans isomerase